MRERGKIAEEIGRVMKENRIRHLSAFMDPEGNVIVNTYGRYGEGQGQWDRHGYQAYYERNAEKIRARARAYYYRNREKVRKYQHEYYLRTRGAGRKGRKTESWEGKGPLKHTELIKAMTRVYSLLGVKPNPEVLEETALQVMQFFGFEREMLANHLEHEDLALLYQLEDMGFVSVRIEEETVSGKPWRINRFRLEVEKIRAVARMQEEKQERMTEEGRIYEELPEEAWAR